MTSEAPPDHVSHDPETSACMHDLLNLFSGLYDWRRMDDETDKLHYRNPAMAEAVIKDTAALLHVTKEDAKHILLTKANHKIVHTEDGQGLVFTYDKNKLPSAAQE